MRMFKTKNGFYSRKRFSSIQAISYFIWNSLDKKTKYAVSVNPKYAKYGYGIHDYKSGKLFLIEYISTGRWKFLGKPFNKLDDINKKKSYLIRKELTV
jgi:hypothetical protein